MKNVSVGGAVRWADRALLGYAGKTIVNAGTTLAVSDITRPYFASRDTPGSFRSSD